jgi:ketosteroid isomerase-like protein
MAADVDLKNFTTSPSAYSVKFKGDNIAVMTHVTVETGAYKGQPFNDYRNSMHVWMKRGNRWQVVASEGAPFTDEQALMQIERDWGTAAKGKDKAWFERTFADEYTAIGSSGKMRNKAQDIADILADSDTVTGDELSDMRVRVFGDTAILTGRLRLKGKSKNGDFDRQYSFTDTFVKRNGSWRVIATQSTLVTPETTAKN